MTDQTTTEDKDGVADAIASVLIISIAVAGFVFWISNQTSAL